MNSVFTRTILAAFVLLLPYSGYAADKTDGKLSRGDRSFIAKALEDGATEVELGKLAQEKGSSDSVKQFGKKMTDDHTKAGDELKTLTGKLGYSPKKDGPKQSAVKKFSKLSGAKFDHEYAENMVKDHEKAVKLFRKEADKGNAAELKQFASNTLPTLEEHLKMARDMKAQSKKK